MKKLSRLLISVLSLLTVFGLSQVRAASAPAETVSAQQMADAIFAVIEADRATYTQKVVQRLQNEDEVITADEHWQAESALPLPAQMLRMGAERVSKNGAGFSYSLQSLWAINKKNEPKTALEKRGLQLASENRQNFYGQEVLGDKKYFTAIYPDVAVSKACVSCHNEHADTPKKDFKVGDVMGGVVIRIPLTK